MLAERDGLSLPRPGTPRWKPNTTEPKVGGTPVEAEYYRLSLNANPKYAEVGLTPFVYSVTSSDL